MAVSCPSCGYREGDALPPGRIIRQRREVLGMKVGELLEKSGIDHFESWIYRLELTRRTAPPMSEFAPLCRVLGLDAQAAACGRMVLTAAE